MNSRKIECNALEIAAERFGFNYDHGHISCDDCAATVINGVPCHEIGCPNTMHVCAGCNEVILANVKYCKDCWAF